MGPLAISLFFYFVSLNVFASDIIHDDVKKDVGQIIYEKDDNRGRDYYEGDLVDDKREGHGMIRWKTGVVYVGDWHDDKIDGQWGVMTWPTGLEYKGQWKAGMMDGVGVWRMFGNGERYDGEFKRAKRHGMGKLRFGKWDSLNRVSYEGEWVEGLRDGKGTMLWTDGSFYTGSWKKGRQEGFGIYYNAVTGARYEGDWFAGKKTCVEAIFKEKNGISYTGSFKDDVRHGEGICTLPHGRRTVERWEGGKKVSERKPLQTLLVLCIEAVGNEEMRHRKGKKIRRGLKKTLAMTRFRLKKKRACSAIAAINRMTKNADQGKQLTRIVTGPAELVEKVNKYIAYMNN